jgi:hypothetical protein
MTASESNATKTDLTADQANAKAINEKESAKADSKPETSRLPYDWRHTKTAIGTIEAERFSSLTSNSNKDNG